MKKLISVILAVLAATPALCACSSEVLPAAAVERSNISARETVPTPEPEKPAPPEYRNIEIILDDGFTCRRSPIFGTRRRFRNLSGEYSIEYVHTPYGISRDDTLSYDITINTDNTYTMTVVANGVTSDHEGRWYEGCGGITFYFDEQIPTPAHNEYVADSMYAEVLPHGKLMIYESGHTIVLSHTTQDPQLPDENMPSVTAHR